MRGLMPAAEAWFVRQQCGSSQPSEVNVRSAALFLAWLLGSCIWITWLGQRVLGADPWSLLGNTVRGGRIYTYGVQVTPFVSIFWGSLLPPVLTGALLLWLAWRRRTKSRANGRPTA